MSDIHSCSYYCTRPACVLRQRDDLRDKLEQAEPVAWMVYTEDGESVYVTDNPADIKPSQRALPLFTTAQQTKPGDNK
jgi:hypothetical protein